MSNTFNKAQIIGGAFQDASGNPLSNGWLTFKLSHDGNVAVLGGPAGSQVVSGITSKLLLDGIGNICANQYLWTNDTLSPSGSYYTVKAYNFQGIEVWNSPQTFVLAPYAPTINLGTFTPLVP